MQTLSLEPAYKLDTSYRQPKNIVVIGAGGTGGYLIPQLARQIALQNELREVAGLAPHGLTLVDEDVVELKNLKRQNFIEPDIGKPKAQVLAERYGGAFGITINYVTKYITSSTELQNLIGVSATAHGIADRSYMPVIVDCVDNNKTRVIMHEAAKEIAQNRGMFFISSGNEEWNGQVICSHLPRRFHQYKDQDFQWNPDNIQKFRTPMLGEMFPEVMNADDKLPTEMSCAERAVSAPQNILTNMTAANLIFTFLNTILTSNSDEEGQGGLEHFAVMFDAQNSLFRTLFNKKSDINKHLQ